jgi:Tfp pilus assembly protein PilN
VRGIEKMATCLGIYVDKNIIKYAKISREKTSTKVEAFGVKVYSDFKQTIDQIIEETFSFKIPISVNMSEEMYNYLYMSDLLSKKDLEKAIKTEFESYCYDKGLNPNALESRYVLVNDANDKEKIKVIHVSIDKIKLNNVVNNFEGYRVTNITPIPLSIASIAPINAKENVAIVNIEDKTTVTIVNGEKVYEVHQIEKGASDILDAINVKENSYAKAYEICKNSTIYTMQGRDLQEKENEYLSDIIPTLYQIATEVNQIVNDSMIKINKIYITGTASVINNVDLYFEELIDSVKCEILKPFFIEDSPKVNMKDYIEVNSAIALALQGLDYGIKDINFSKVKAKFSGITMPGSKEGNSSTSEFFRKINNITISNKQLGAWLIRCFAFTIIVFIAYSGIALVIKQQADSKEKQISKAKDYTNQQISLIKKDTTSVNDKITEYNTLTKNLQDATSAINEKNSYKNTIPVLLSQIMNVIPKQVQLTSIENTTDKKIVINAQSAKYEQLAYFKARLKSEGILEPTTVVSSEAVKDGDVVKIVIEGELP